MTQVLIAVDDSDCSIKAARVAFDLFGAEATYTVVNVADQSPMMWGDGALLYGVGYPVVMAPTGVVVGSGAPAGSSDVDTAEIDAAMQVALDVATEADIPNPQVVGETSHDPATAIISAAHHRQADVIVIGSHDRSWFSKLFIPSVAGSVVKEADIPVLIAR
jgi:nucleotide-binding universal stress UspA family protein